MAAEADLPQIAILGACIFVRNQYIPRLGEIADFIIIKAIWSRSEESARVVMKLARDFTPQVECKWGETCFEDIIRDSTIIGVTIVFAEKVQVDTSLKMLRAGKHVIQEKPATASTTEIDDVGAVTDFTSISASSSSSTRGTGNNSFMGQEI